MEELVQLRLQVRSFLYWFNRDGSPCDGPRFRDEQNKLRTMVGLEPYPQPQPAFVGEGI